MGNKSNEIINRKVSGGMANTKLASRKRAKSSHSSLLCESGKREQEVLKGARLPSELRVPQLFELIHNRFYLLFANHQVFQLIFHLPQ